MPYNRLNLQSGVLLTAEHIKHIEDGIVESYNLLQSGDDDSSIPTYYYTETARVINLIEAFKANHPNHLVFGAVTDTHISNSTEIISKWNITQEEASKKSIQHATYALEIVGSAARCDFIANLGDMCEEVYIDPDETGYLNGEYDRSRDGSLGYKNARYAIKTFAPTFDELTSFSLVGNHEKTKYNTQLYDTIGIYCDFDEESTKGQKVVRCFGYKDYTDKKVRVIVLNTCDYLNASGGCALSYEQKDFLMRALDLTDSYGDDASAWQILLLSHIPLDWNGGDYGFYEDLQIILNAYEDGTEASITVISSNAKNETPSEYPTYSNGKLVYDYTDKNVAKIIANIHGHLHNNKVGKIVNTNILRVSTANANPYKDTAERYTQYGDYSITTEEATKIVKQPGTARDTSVTFYCIDLDEQVIYEYVYGARDEEGDRTIVYSAEVNAYDVTHELTNCTLEYDANTIVHGEPYEATLQPDSGFEMGEVIITMGNVDITAMAYNASDGTIYIAAVTGPVHIKATAKAVKSYTNVIDTVGTIDGVRLRSGGGTQAGEGFASNYFPVKSGDVIRVSFPNGNRASILSNGMYCVLYNSDKSTVAATYNVDTSSTVLKNATTTGYEIHIPTDVVCSYARVAGAPTGGYTDWIVTVNEEIK